jgi:periplasmic glucans biosynthesis protein
MWRNFHFLAGLFLCAGAGLAPVLAAGQKFNFDSVRLRAQILAARPYHGQPSPVPDWLRHLDYDQFRDIRFSPVKSWWNREALPFKLQFFHPGFTFDRTVQIYEVADDGPKLIPFSADYFDYGHNQVGPLPPTMGYAGFRIHYPLNEPGDELGVFLGASYFRFLCRNAVYGMSARGLAIDTAQPGGEEFPNFEDFWVERPEPTSTRLTVYALLDGPTAVGAYSFDIAPGGDTVTTVHAVIFCRKNPAVLGLAPLTSMFWHGKNTDFETDDVRPEVHDSDGLQLKTGAGEWIWHPLNNPAATRVMSFFDENPRGFGLFQRERRFDDYEDLEAIYHRRPSTWVEPVGQWGRGSVRLVELHAPNEASDNIVAFWVPEELPLAGSPIELTYRLHWFIDQIHPPAGFVTATRQGHSQTFQPELHLFVIDFAGGGLEKEKADSGIEAKVKVGAGAALVHLTVQKNLFDETWRAVLALRPDGSGRPVELSCFLHRASHVLTETWGYLWSP